MDRSLMALCVLLAVGWFVPCHAAPTTVDVVASDWGYVQADFPDTPTPAASRLYWVGMTSTGPWRLFLKFDLPAEIGSNSNITSVIYSQISNTPNNGMDGKLTYCPDDSWSSPTLTWNNKPAVTGDSPFVDVVAGWLPRDVSEDIVGIFPENGGQTVTLEYKAASENAFYYNQVSIGSTDTPALTITYIPEPTAIGLLLAGMMPLLRKRRK